MLKEAVDKVRKALKISPEVIKPVQPAFDSRRAYMPPLTLGVPNGEKDDAVVAMDAALSGLGLFDLLGQNMGAMYGVPEFIGYPALSNLSQNGLICAGVDSVADEMTRKWLELVSTNDEGADTEKLEKLTRAMENIQARQVFNDAAKKCGLFGGCLVYLDLGETSEEELKKPLVLDSAKVRKGSLRRLTLVEPINLYPGQYNASDPLSPDYFKPSTWRVLGKEIHASRFLYFASNVPPLLLRPAYNFFGIAMAQIALDYVAGFTGNREAAARLLNKFSLTIWSTNMEDLLSGATTENIDRRAAYAAQQRTNDGIMMLDKELESMEQINTPLSGVTDIVQMSLELLSAIFRVPAVKLFGISPKGFNATGEADMRNFYDYVSSQQEKIFGKPMEQLLRLLQLHLFGEIDDSITHRFLPLWEMDPAQSATIRKSDADTANTYITAGVLSPEEVRDKLAKDEGSGWQGLDLSVVPEPSVDPAQPADADQGEGEPDAA